MKAYFFYILFIFCLTCNVPPKKTKTGILLWVSNCPNDIIVKNAVKYNLDNSDIIIAQVPWFPGDNKVISNVAWYSMLAKQHGKKLMINLDIQKDNRSGLKNDFSFLEKENQIGFLSDLEKLIITYEPDFLTPAVEINYLALTNVNEFKVFINLISKFKNTHKGKAKVGLSFQLELIEGNHKGWGRDSSKQVIRSIYESLDYIGISTYPDLQIISPIDLGDRILLIKKEFNRKVSILETGISVNNSDSFRLKYFNELLKIVKSGNLELCILGSTVDMRKSDNLSDSIGLLNANGDLKPEAKFWRDNRIN